MAVWSATVSLFHMKDDTGSECFRHTFRNQLRYLRNIGLYKQRLAPSTPPGPMPNLLLFWLYSQVLFAVLLALLYSFQRSPWSLAGANVFAPISGVSPAQLTAPWALPTSCPPALLECWPDTRWSTNLKPTALLASEQSPDKHHSSCCSCYSPLITLVLTADVEPLRIPTTRLQTALNLPTAVPSHLTQAHFLAPPPPRTPDCHSSTTRGMALLGDLSFYYQYCPFPCTSPLPWKLGIIPRNRKYFKACRAYLVSSEGWSYKARDSGTESHGHPLRDSSASSGWAPGQNDAASAQSAAVKPRSFCWMKSQLPCWCALAPFQLHRSSLSCRGLQLGGCFLLAWIGLKNKAKKERWKGMLFTIGGWVNNTDSYKDCVKRCKRLKAFQYAILLCLPEHCV